MNERQLKIEMALTLKSQGPFLCIDERLFFFFTQILVN